ncbi:CoA-binding protein [soil metagenome]
MSTKKTLVIGASENPVRYSNIAINRLKGKGHEVLALGLKAGNVAGVPIQTGQPEIEDLDTVTLYVGSDKQQDLIEYVIGLHPERVIFNPGTENTYFEERLMEAGIEVTEACTLVLLSTGQY